VPWCPWVRVYRFGIGNCPIRLRGRTRFVCAWKPAVGSLVVDALRAVKKGGRVVCGGIHMSDIPSFAYQLLWHEREIVSVANLTRADAHDFFAVAPRAGIVTTTTRYALQDANRALADLRHGMFEGAAVLVP